jgi:apolipoprotein D and lipocalin family protein
MKTKSGFYMTLLMMLFVNGACARIPKGAEVIKPFHADRYLGKWYEIARFDFRFERNLNNTTATYSLNADGSIKVDNKGYDYVKKVWKQSIGKAKFRGSRTEAALKVSFFGPFYAPYNVIALDAHYQYALVAGQNLDYLWILAREKTIPDEVKKNYLEIAEKIGFDTNRLIWVEHN